MIDNKHDYTVWDHLNKKYKCKFPGITKWLIISTKWDGSLDSSENISIEHKLDQI